MTMRKLVSLILVLLAVSRFAFAQGAATGDVHVTVKDPKGSLVTNATVTARDQAKGLERSVTGNTQGEYRIQLLPPGNYQITVDAPGFAKATVENVVVTVGQVLDLPVSLTLAGAQEVINVSAASELIETSRTSTTDTIEQKAHRQPSYQWSQLHQLCADGFAGAARQRSQYWRGSHVRIEHKRAARAFEPGERRRR